MKHYQVIVIGGGFSGAMAAMSAAREGLSVLLVEKTGALGGAAVVNYVLPFMNYHLQKEGQRIRLNRGLFGEFIDRLIAYQKEEGTKEDVIYGAGYYNEEYLKLVLDDMTDAYGVDVLFHSTLVDTQTEDGRILSCRVANIEGLQTLCADYFIDATGDAQLAMLSGCPYHVGRDTDQKCQPMTLCFRMGKVDMNKWWSERHAAIALWKEKLAAGELLNPREDILTFRHTTPDVLHLNSTRVLLSTVDALEKSKAEKVARRQMLELFRFLRANTESCKNATLLSSAMEIGVRESRMIDGLYSITTEDIVECRKFEDAIATGNYEIDIHSPDGSGTHHVPVPVGDFYTIPYRALIPKGKDNLLVVGRCISSNHDAQAAYRIMPIVACIGEGAGIALSLIAKDKAPTYTVSTPALQVALDKYDLIEK